MSKPIAVAIITTDLRDDHRRYAEPEPSFGAAPTSLLQGLKGLEGCEVHVVSCVQQPVASPSKIAENMFYHPVKIGKWGWMRGAYAGCVSAVRRKLREIRPDVVHGQGTERYCALSAVFSGFPNVLTIHGNMRLVAAVNKAPPFSFEWLAARLEGFTIPKSGGVVCISSYTRKAVEPLARRTWSVPNAVDKTFFDTPHDAGSPPAILCLGTICVRKNQNAFIRALEPLAGEIPFKLVFAGGLNKAEAYAQEFLQLVSARPWCEYRGFGNAGFVKGLMTSATMLALPTQEDNCPMVILEAAAAGIPAVASRVGGVPDLIEHDVTGLLFDVESPAAMREAVSRMLGRPAEAALMAAAAKRYALKHFHPDVIARRHLEIYNEVLDTP